MQQMKALGFRIATDTDEVVVTVPGARAPAVTFGQTVRLLPPALGFGIVLSLSFRFFELGLTPILLAGTATTAVAWGLTLRSKRRFNESLGFPDYPLRLDLANRVVHIPAHSDWPASSFAIDEVHELGIDWSRGHGQVAVPDAPIVYAGVDAGEPVPGSLDLSGCSAEQAGALVRWFAGAIEVQVPANLAPEDRSASQT